MGKLDSIVNEKEKQRNYKLVCDFDKERTNLENEQVKVRDQIEELSKRNVNEKNIKMIKEEKSKQQDWSAFRYRGYKFGANDSGHSDCE